MLTSLHDDLIAHVSHPRARFAQTFTLVAAVAPMSAAALHGDKVCCPLLEHMLRLCTSLSSASDHRLLLTFHPLRLVLWQLLAWLLLGMPEVLGRALPAEHLRFVARKAAGEAATQLEQLICRRMAQGPGGGGRRRRRRAARRERRALDKVEAAIWARVLVYSVGGTL